MRLFYAIELDERTKELLSEKQNLLRAKAVKANFSRRENLHLTLRFFGEVERAYFPVLKKIQDIISSKHRAFELEILELGIFERGHKSIVWSGIKKNPNLMQLQRDIEKEIILNGFKPDHRPFNPHITLAREFAPYGDIREIIKEIEPLNHRFIVKSISLMESTRLNGKLVYICRYRTNLLN